MYSVNGIPLDSPQFGWVFRAPSKPLSELTRDLQALQRAGRDGVVAGLGGTTGPVIIPMMVQTPRANLESLVSLFGAVGVLNISTYLTREVQFETMGHSLTGYGPAEAIVDATFQLRLPASFWRDKLDSTPSAPLGAASVVLNVFPGLSAPVQDAIVRVKGAATGIQVTDASGAWVILPNVTASQYVRFECDTGKAFITTTDTWTGGTDVSGQVDFGGPRGVFEITPVLAPLDPSTRKGVLTTATASRTGAVVAVRGKAAYAI